MGVVFSISPAPLYGVLCGAWQIRGAFPLTYFFDAKSTAVNITVSGLVDAYNRSQPVANASATFAHWYGQTMLGYCLVKVISSCLVPVIFSCLKPLICFFNLQKYVQTWLLACTLDPDSRTAVMTVHIFCVTLFYTCL